MKAAVIAITSLEASRQLAERCVASGERHGLEVTVSPAVTPADNPLGEFHRRGWPTKAFTRNVWSKPLPCLATFLSHARLWAECAESGDSLVILEHDAIVEAPIPCLGLSPLTNLARPSFGAFATPERRPYLGPIVSKRHLPGAHGYAVTPWGAERLLEKAIEAEPTDVYVCRERFPFLEEFYPWPIVAEDSFSTIQRSRGCKAKHNKVEPLAW